MLPSLFAGNKQKSNYNPAAANINSHLSNRLQPVYQHVASFVCVFLFLLVFHVCELFLQLNPAFLSDIIVKKTHIDDSLSFVGFDGKNIILNDDN